MNRNEFEHALLGGIPQHEAASFFLRIKKAGWADAPDETGELEGQFVAPIEQVISSLTEVIAAKWRLMMAYHVYAESMRGIAQHGVSEVFHEHAEQERAAAEAYLKRAAVLGGGPVHLLEIEPPPASSDPVGIAMLMARAEQEGIAAQAALRQMVGDQNPLAFSIEQYMIEDQHHLDELWQMLPQDMVRTPVIDVGGADPAAAGGEEGLEVPPELPEEVPPESPLPPPAAAKPPAPKADKPKLTEGQKEAFALGLTDLRLKQAGVADDIIGSMSPEDKRQLLHEERLRSMKDHAHGVAEGVKDLVSPLTAPGAGRVLRASTGLGAVLGLSSGANMTKSREKQLRAGGPINRFRADHPMLTGTGLGAATGAGAMAGGLLASRSGAGLPGALAGGVLPRALVSVADRALKGREDRRAAEQLKQAFARGLQKLGFAPSEPGFGTDPGAAPMPDTQQQIVPQASMEAPGVQPPMATPPGQAQYAPVNYLEAEETARRAQASNEAEFYRAKAQEADGQVASMSQQFSDVQAQLDQLSAQAAESQSQIMQANQEAVTANDQMLNQATLAARMRMGMQQLRAQMMEIASQDPEQLAAAAGGPTPMDVGNQAAMAQGGPAPLGGGDPAAGGSPGGAPPGDPSAEPGAQPGTPGASPDPGAAPGSTPSGAGGPPSASASPDEPKKSDGESAPAKKDSGGETTVSIKKGSFEKRADIMSESMTKLPYAAAGAALGAGAGYIHAKRGANIPTLRQQVDALKGQEQEGGFGKTLELAKAQLALGAAEDARANPGRSALRGGLMGATLATGLQAAVPAGIEGGKRLAKNLGDVWGNMRSA